MPTISPDFVRSWLQQALDPLSVVQRVGVLLAVVATVVALGYVAAPFSTKDQRCSAALLGSAGTGGLTRPVYSGVTVGRRPGATTYDGCPNAGRQRLLRAAVGAVVGVTGGAATVVIFAEPSRPRPERPLL